MPAKQRFSRYDIPWVFVTVALMFGIAAVASQVSAKRDLITETQLTRVSGTIQRVRIVRTKYDHFLDFDLIANDGKHHLSQDDLSKEFPALNDLQAGDRIDARVHPGAFGVERYWEIRRAGVEILSYGQTNHFFVDGAKNIGVLVSWFERISLLFVIGAIALKLCIGWRPEGETTSATESLSSSVD